MVLEAARGLYKTGKAVEILSCRGLRPSKTLHACVGRNSSIKLTSILAGRMMCRVTK